MATTSVFPLIVVLLHIAEGLIGDGPLCLSCDKVVLPRDCGHVTRCGVHEKCVTTKYVTSSAVVWYRVGCKSAQTCDHPSSHGRRKSVGVNEAALCVSCCNDTALCNQHGCGTVGFDARNKICYNCAQHRTPNSCDDVTMCSEDQTCIITKTNFGVDNFYSSGCSPILQCYQSDIARCCNSSLCNNDLNITMTSTSVVTSVRTTVPSTTRGVTRVTARTTKATAASCASGWIPDIYSNVQYCRHDDVGLTSWSAAKAVCEQNNTHLPIVESRDQLDFIHSLLKDRQPNTLRNVWMDGTDTNREGYWVWSTTAKLISPLFWSPSQPDNYNGPHVENCLMFGEEYMWGYNDATCDRHVSVLCQHGSPPTPHFAACPSGNWIEHLDRMYCIVTQDSNWYEAKAFCTSLAAHLPIVDTVSEDNYLRGLVAHGDVWLDATEEWHNGVFQWSSTGTAIRFTNWNSGEPNDYANHLEQCVEYGETYGWRWNDAPCNERRATIHKVICERYKPQTSSPVIG